MKAVVRREEFAEALKRADKAINPKAMGTLTGYQILFRSEGKSIVMGASAECTIRALFDAETDVDFEVVTTQEALGVVSRVSCPDITISCGSRSQSIQIKGGDTVLELPVLDVEVPQPKSAYRNRTENSYELDSLPELVGGVMHSVASDNLGNPWMSSIRLRFSGEGAEAAALDGVRFSTRGCLPGDGATILVNRVTMKLVADMMKGKTLVEWDSDAVTFSDEKTIIDCVPTDGEFFNIERLLQTTQCSCMATFNRLEAVHAIELAMVVGSKAPSKRIRVSISEDTASLSSITGKGKIKTSFPVSMCSMDGTAGGDFGVNGDFLLDALKNIHDEDLTMGYSGETAPILIRNEEYTEFLLPCKLN